MKLNKQKLEALMVEQTRKRWEMREMNQKKSVEEQKKTNDEKMKKLQRAEQHRLKVKEDVHLMRLNHVNDILNMIGDKEERARQENQKRGEEMERQKVMKYLKSRERELKQLQLQRKQDYIKQKTMQNIKEKTFRAQMLKELKQATVGRIRKLYFYLSVCKIYYYFSI